MSDGQKGLYFAHPINTYNTPLEASLLEAIKQAFPDQVILNPNSPEHQAGFQQYKEAGNSMLYFSKEVLPSCLGCVALPFPDGKWGAGVYKEMLDIFVMGFPLWSIDPLTKISELPELPGGVITIAETRRRIKLPYEEAV